MGKTDFPEWLSAFTSPGDVSLIPGMLKSGAWLVSPLLFLSHVAVNSQVLPDADVPAAVDTITPVPPPEILLGEPGEVAMEMPKDLKIQNQGGKIEGDTETGVRLGGPVKIEGDNGMEIFSNTAVLDLKQKTVTLDGDVIVYQGNLMQRGNRAVYHYERKFLDASSLRASMDPLLLEAGKFTVEQHGDKQVYVGHEAGITTHDVEEPNYWIRAQKTRIYPGEKVVFNNLRLYAGDTPVFWLPYLSQTLNADLGYHFTPGGRSNWGPYLLNTYGIMLGGETDPVTGENTDAWLLSRWNLDLRSKRGIGTGLQLSDTRNDFNEDISGLNLYYLNDLAPNTTRSGMSRGFVNEDRYALEFKHRITPDFPDDADWKIDANLSWLSDAHYLEDFDLARYRIEPEPDNTLGIYRRDENSLLSFYTRYQINDFYRADSRLPEVVYDQARRPLFDLPVLHEGSTSLGLIGERAADSTRIEIINPMKNLNLGDPEATNLLNQLEGYERELATQMLAEPIGSSEREAIRNQLLDSSFARFHTYQEVSLPTTLGGFLSLTPRAGIGYTRYDSAEGPVESMSRTHLHAGAETSLKFSKHLGGYQDSRLGLDGLLHVFQPYANWSIIATDDFNEGDPAVDRLTPTTRPRPLVPARFTAIDEMQSWNVLRLGSRNRLLTKRDRQTFEWLYLDTYLDAFIDDPEGQRDFSNLYNDLRWQPLPWLGLETATQFPIANGGSGFSELSNRLHFTPTENFDFTVGYRWLNGHPELPDSSRFTLQSYSRLSENWGIGTRHSLELDDGTLEYQQYTLHRDLGNWVVGMGLSMRDNRLEEEYGMVFSITLKDFPSVSLPFELDAE